MVSQRRSLNLLRVAEKIIKKPGMHDQGLQRGVPEKNVLRANEREAQDHIDLITEMVANVDV